MTTSILIDDPKSFSYHKSLYNGNIYIICKANIHFIENKGRVISHRFSFFCSLPSCSMNWLCMQV